MKKIVTFTLLMFIALTAQFCTKTQENNLKLWYTKPAKVWVEALPIGNGRLGAMVYGDPISETIQLNENTVWAGQPNRNDNTNAKKALPKIRKLIFDGKYKEAQDLANEKFISKKSQGSPYETIGNLILNFPDHENYTNYYRDLNIEKAITTTKYTVNGINFTSEMFSSSPDQIMVAKISADKPGVINFSATLNRPSNYIVSSNGNDELILSGITGNNETVKGAVKFETRVKIITKKVKFPQVIPP